MGFDTEGAAAGAAAGAATGGWYGAAIGGVTGGFKDPKKGSGMGDSETGFSPLTNGFTNDFGGFNVSFGNDSPISASRTQSAADAVTSGAQKLVLPVLVIVGVLIGLKIWKKS